MHASSRSVWRADSVALMPGAISDALLSLPPLRVPRSHRQWRARGRTTWAGRVAAATERAGTSESIFDGSLTVALSEWSEWDERHGRIRREVTVGRGGSCRDTNAAIRPNEN